KFVSRQPCLVCGRTPSDPHHLRFVQPCALGRRVSDEFTVPLCRVHHRDLHHRGDEAGWWGKLSIDPVPVALKLWQHTRVNGTAIPISGGTELGSATATQASQRGPAGTTLDPNIRAGSSACKTADGPRFDRSRPAEAMHTGAPVRKPKLANGGHAEIQFDSD